MGMWSKSTAATASGDTTKTLVGSITVPSAARKIRRILLSLNTAGMTTLEGIAGLLEFVSDNNPEVQNLQLPFGGGAMVTSGALAIPVQGYDVDVPVVGNSVVSCYVTMDAALTINPTARVALQGE